MGQWYLLIFIWLHMLWILWSQVFHFPSTWERPGPLFLPFPGPLPFFLSFSFYGSSLFSFKQNSSLNPATGQPVSSCCILFILSCMGNFFCISVNGLAALPSLFLMLEAQSVSFPSLSLLPSPLSSLLLLSSLFLLLSLSFLLSSPLPLLLFLFSLPPPLPFPTACSLSHSLTLDKVHPCDAEPWPPHNFASPIFAFSPTPVPPFSMMWQCSQVSQGLCFHGPET